MLRSCALPDSTMSTRLTSFVPLAGNLLLSGRPAIIGLDRRGDAALLDSRARAQGLGVELGGREGGQVTAECGPLAFPEGDGNAKLFEVLGHGLAAEVDLS